jgi:hypothetical protein
MKRPPAWLLPLALLSCLASVAALAAWAETPLPAPFPEARYQQMSARSPFAIATAAAAPTAAPTPGFAAQLYVDGVAHVGKSDFVAIKSRDPDQQNVIFLEVGKSNADGLKVERIMWSNEMGKSTVDVSKAGERATLEFDEQTVKSVATTAAAAPPNQPGIRLPPMPGGRPMNFPMQNGQPAFNRFYQQQPGYGPAGMNLPQSVINMQRRRVRSGMIQSGQ